MPTADEVAIGRKKGVRTHRIGVGADARALEGVGEDEAAQLSWSEPWRATVARMWRRAMQKTRLL